MAPAHLSQNLITSWKVMYSEETVSTPSSEESFDLMKATTLERADGVQHLKEVLQAIAACADFLSAHHFFSMTTLGTI